jgi:Collagen triple helix repeat (20 copies)
MAIDKIFNDANVDGIADNIFGAVNNSVSEVKAMQQRKAAENVQVVVEALKKIETNITEKFDNVTDVIEKRVLTIKDGRDGSSGSDGRNGRDGKPGRDGVNGKQGTPGTPGKDGTDGIDGVSVTDANIDFDGSLVISLSSGQQINVGEVVPPELERQLVELRQGGGSAGSSGDVVGPTSSTDNAIVRFDGTTGKLVQNSVVTIADTTGNMVGVGAMGIGTPTISSGYSLDVQNGLVLARIESTTGANAALFVVKNTAGSSIFGNEGSTASTFTGAYNYATILGTDSARALQFATNNIVRFEVNSSGAFHNYGSMTIATTLGVTGATTLTSGTISTTPSGSTDIANKSYVDTVAQGLDTKASVIAGTTANITLSGTQTIDGVVLVAADRVLVKNQTLSQNNGIYLCASAAWTRTTDMNTYAQVPGAYVFVEGGTTLADTGWVCTSNAGGTLGTTAITWAQFSGAGSGVSSINFGTTGLTPSAVTTGAVTVAGTLAVANGGTGVTTSTGSTNVVLSNSPTLTGTIAAASQTLSGTLGVTGVSTLTSGAVIQGMTVGLGGGAVATNTVVGATALSLNTTGYSNTATGHNALHENTIGIANTAIGSSSLYYNTLGDQNVAIGASSALNNISGIYNTVGGNGAMQSSKTGSRNTVFGNAALLAYAPPVVTAGAFVIATSYTIVSVGSTNFVAIGASSNTVGVLFTATGVGSGNGTASTNVDATNTVIGYASGSAITTGTKNTIIGAYSGNQGSLDIRTASNYVVLSDGDGNPRAYWNGANATFNGGLAVTGTLSSTLGANFATTSGSVGIGTASPANKLTLADNSASAMFYGTQSGAGDLFALANSASEKFRITNAGTLSGGTSGTGYSFSGSAPATSLTLDTSGNLGIGTATALATASGRGNVTINGSSNSILVLGNGGAISGYVFGDANSLGFSAGSGANSRVMTFDTNGTERMRLDSSGNLLVGTTSTTGSASNTTIVAGGKFKTVSGSVSAANNTATTLFTAPTALTAWLVTINVDADSVLYAATYVVNTQGGSSTVATLLYKGANVSISVSGYSVQATQTSGATATIQYSAVRIY